ncbi:MAG: discoidin domain-containing protein, partial [Acidimicrobiales bacterium]
MRSDRFSALGVKRTPSRVKAVANRKSGPFATLTLIGVVMAVVAMVGFSAGGNASPSARATSSALSTRGPDMADMVMPDLQSYRLDAPALIPEGWTADATSQASGHSADEVLNGETPEFWESRPGAKLPQSITLDMQTAQEISSLNYAPRQGKKTVGAIGRFEIRVSDNAKHFGSPIATGTWQDTTAVKSIGFAPVVARYVRLTALSYAAGSGTSVTASDVTLYGMPQEEAASDAAPESKPSTNPSISGSWGSTIGFPLIPVAAALLPDNQLLTWSADADETFAVPNTVNYTQTAILNLNTGVVTQVEVSNTDHNMFCPGVAILANGEILVAGGDTDDATSIYNPATDSWSKGPPMNIPRGYNGVTLLSGGQVFTLGGSWSGGIGGKTAEVWSSTAGWRELPGVPENLIETNDTNKSEADSYGWFIASSNNNVLVAGPAKKMDWVTTSGAGSITEIGTRSNAPVEMEGNAVYFNTDEVLALGGAPDFSGTNSTNDPATNKAYVINFASGTPVVTPTGSMRYPRTYANSVV